MARLYDADQRPASVWALRAIWVAVAAGGLVLAALESAPLETIERQLVALLGGAVAYGLLRERLDRERRQGSGVGRVARGVGEAVLVCLLVGFVLWVGAGALWLGACATGADDWCHPS